MKVGELCDHNIIHTRYIYTGFGMQLVHMKAWNCMKCCLLLWEMSQHTCDHHWLGNGIDLEAMNSPFLLLVTFSSFVLIRNRICFVWYLYTILHSLYFSCFANSRIYLFLWSIHLSLFNHFRVNCFGGRDIAELGLMYLSRLLVLSKHRLWLFTASVTNIDAKIKSILPVYCSKKFYLELANCFLGSL